MKATRVKDVSEKFAGTAVLYKLDPPVGYNHNWETGKPRSQSEYVVASAVIAFGYPETYIFPTDEEGNVLSWGELEGSFKGDLDPDRAINNAGYTIQ